MFSRSKYTTLICTTLAVVCCFGAHLSFAEQAASTPVNHALIGGQSPTGLTVTNSTTAQVYANLILGQPAAAPLQGCTAGKQITSISDQNLQFSSSAGKTITFSGPSGVSTKGAYLMDPGETITYIPKKFPCFNGQTCTPALTANFFFTDGFNGTANGNNGNNGCGGTGTTYPNATNLAELSINFGANGAVGSTCANADDTDISAVNGVNATLKIDTTDPGTGAAWPSATSVAENKALGENTNSPGVFGWAATNCTNPQGFPNPTKLCAAPVDAPLAVNGTCPSPNTLITGPTGTQYCAQTSQAGTCNNQRAAFNTGGTIKVTYKGQIAPQKKSSK